MLRSDQNQIINERIHVQCIQDGLSCFRWNLLLRCLLTADISHRQPEHTRLRYLVNYFSHHLAITICAIFFTTANENVEKACASFVFHSMLSSCVVSEKTFGLVEPEKVVVVVDDGGDGGGAADIGHPLFSLSVA